MNDDIFEFDIDAELAKAEKNAEKKADEVPEPLSAEDDCEGCKI
ncbi:hypothetical protein Sant_1647 [Sodalis praecaptivus]|uniref:Uncharacterized protein n=1 Tax=Sodalis praecaptivus TaxID=1239307 RepID=W0HW02_9GAMM|nr:hypothetical protein [Sodalis praecaptivus]AHF76702.1 hypothetical protein Sant_1647 [Sodalis praecaptivus]